MNENKLWVIHDVWNKVLDETDVKVAEPRDRMWASELWKQDLDIILKLKGTQPTNEPTARAIRKMEMGDLVEQNFELALKRVGILKTLN